MLSTKSFILVCLLGGLSGLAVAVGCGASGVADDLSSLQVPATPPDSGSGSPPSTTIPPSNSGGGEGPDDGDPEDGIDAGVDSGKKDAGPKDAGTDAAQDAGLPAPTPGAPCAVANQKYQRTCGTCGKQSAVCIAKDGGAGGIVSDYGACRDEVANGCVPGTQETVACGNCGTQTRTCNAFCSWSSSGCQGQPAQSCTPNSVELDGLTCQDNLYRRRACSASCTWGNYSAQCEAPPSSLVAPLSIGGITTTYVNLTEDQTAQLLAVSARSCPLTSFATETTPYAYIEVKNEGPKAVTVSIFTAQPTGAPSLDTVLGVYQGTTIPTTAAARKACKGYVADDGTTTLTGSYNYASLDGAKAVTIPANSSVQVYVASYLTWGVTEVAGTVKVGVKTESIAP